MKRAAIILALLGASAHAEFMTGNKLLSDMQGDSGDRIHAIGYVIGVADSVRGEAFCPPNNITAGQITDMVRNFLVNTPAIRHFTGDIIVTHVLKSTWPCAAKPSGRGV